MLIHRGRCQVQLARLQLHPCQSQTRNLPDLWRLALLRGVGQQARRFVQVACLHGQLRCLQGSQGRKSRVVVLRQESVDHVKGGLLALVQSADQLLIALGGLNATGLQAGLPGSPAEKRPHAQGNPGENGQAVVFDPLFDRFGLFVLVVVFVPHWRTLPLSGFVQTR